MPIDKDTMFLYLWKRNKNSTIDIKDLKIIESFTKLFFEDNILRKSKYEILNLLNENESENNNLILKLRTENNNSTNNNLSEQYNLKDIILMSLDIYPRKYIYERLNISNDSEKIFILDSIIDKCIQENIFSLNSKEKIKNCILEKISIEFNVPDTKILLTDDITFDNVVTENDGSLTLIEDVSGVLLTIGSLLLKFGIPLAAIYFIAEYIYKLGRYEGLRNLGKLLESRGEDIRLLITKTFIHCINSEKKLSSSIDKNQLIKSCEKKTELLLKQMETDLSNCLSNHTEDHCYKELKRRYRDIFELDVTDTKEEKKKGGK